MKIYLPFLLLLIGHSVASHATEDSLWVAEIRKLALAGDADALYSLGFMYANGDGVPESDKTAVMWYTKAAEQGDARAQTHLGLMYDIGDGVLKNDTTAVMWYTKAAELGEGRAQYNLGLKYANGEGVPENDIKAYVWYALAKANGFFWAKNNLELLKQEMTKPQIAKAQELAAKRHASGLKACD